MCLSWMITVYNILLYCCAILVFIIIIILLFLFLIGQATYIRVPALAGWQELFVPGT